MTPRAAPTKHSHSRRRRSSRRSAPPCQLPLCALGALNSRAVARFRPRRPSRRPSTKPGLTEVETEIAELVDQSTHDLRLAWRRMHCTEPPVGLSRDLLIRALVDDLQQQTHGGTRAERCGAVCRPWPENSRKVAGHIQGQAPHRRRRVELLRHRNASTDSSDAVGNAPASLRASTATVANRSGKTAVLEYGPTEILPCSALYSRPARVSAANTVSPAFAHPRKTPASRPRKANSRGRLTVCWREVDSNFWFRTEQGVGRVPASPALWSRQPVR